MTRVVALPKPPAGPRKRGAYLPGDKPSADNVLNCPVDFWQTTQHFSSPSEFYYLIFENN